MSRCDDHARMPKSREGELGTHGEPRVKRSPVHAIVRDQATGIAERPRELDRVGIDVAQEAIVRRHVERSSSGASLTRNVFRA